MMCSALNMFDFFLYAKECKNIPLQGYYSCGDAHNGKGT